MDLTPPDTKLGDVRRINPFENFIIVMRPPAIAFIAGKPTRATGYYLAQPFSSRCGGLFTVTDGMEAVLLPGGH
ncbi:hypothetical protein SAE02_54010 [Skermanella aerolata]|uniref:Uncharacterized protein n=1 Tax=Skermanella aerolata TaxID=393310 RepID=A0A512DXP3_9PROT|nr:hypothetical protein SAE02_54010 [Skermanella aerolata]